MNRHETSPESKPLAAEDQPTRGRIVAAALHEFAVHGREGARIDRIAQTAGVNKAMIYYHFRSKDQLYIDVVVSFARAMFQQIRGPVFETSELSRALEIMAERHVEAFLDAGPIRPIILRELANPTPEVMDSIADVLTSTGLPQKIMTLIEQGEKDGRFRPIDIRQAIVAFVSMSIGYFIIAPIQDRALGITDRASFVRERQKVIVDLFLNGLKVR
ncbi:MAG: TetR/AcrR family transcriptional regulator [Candidatus Zixiibacteriota bacterium]